MKNIKVKLGASSYPVFIEASFAPLRKQLSSMAAKACLLTSPTVYRVCYPALQKVIPQVPVIVIPDGERAKHLKTVERAYHELIRKKADRDTVLLLLGGGVMGDLGGFVAATFLRGLRFVQIPTTLVAQVDSSIGGKVGVDLPEGKNLVGAFAHPLLVFSNVSLLKTLSHRDLLGGMGEVIKYGVIADAKFFHWMMAQREAIFSRHSDTLSRIVRVSAQIKADVVSQDERESGLRMVLNFGHTFGHALEKITGYKKYTHGEAVALGMVIAARLSHALGYCRSEVVDEIVGGIRLMGLPTQYPDISSAAWQRAIGVDKKRRGGKIRFVFVEKIGKVTIAEELAANLVRHV